MNRITLPDRRRSVTQYAVADGFEIKLTIGFNDAALPKEVFADGIKTGTAMSALLSDACILISRQLQTGITPEQLSKSLGRVPDPMAGKGADKPASAIGVIISVLISEADKHRSAA